MRLASAASATEPSEPGTTGTPAFFMSSRAAALLPIMRMTSPDGPIHVMPFFSHSSANSAFSERKPYPGWMASQCAALATVRMASVLR